MELLPPSRDGLLRNARLLLEEWRAAAWLPRYFMLSQALSGALLALCSLGSLAAGLAGRVELYLGLLAAGALCLVHTIATFGVLKRRFKVRYEIF
ncbi:MAG TPA: hypothetical protein VM240_11950 [Verrucomicrobiae bacterium]|nr:hypothetical protein [Verrucomicrobiae bacterium]